MRFDESRAGSGEPVESESALASKDSNSNTPTEDKTPAELFGGTPSHGWAVRMDHHFQETWNQCVRPRLRQLIELLPMCFRYIFWWFSVVVLQRRRPVLDCRTLDGKQIYGVPIGGIGSGTIGRGYKGEFCRFQMTPGLYTYEVVPADQFILTVRNTQGDQLYQKVLTGAGNPGVLSAWDWSYNKSSGTCELVSVRSTGQHEEVESRYLGLYPRAWYVYSIPEENLTVRCKQISPVIPNNYKDSCIPAAVFIWSVENHGLDAKEVSITFTFKNGTGSRKDDKKNKCSSVSFEVRKDGVGIHGVALEHKVGGIDTTYGLGCLEKPGVAITHMTSFDLKHGSDIWEKLCTKGRLDTESCSYEISKGELGSAVNSSGLVTPNSSLEMVFSLVWDQPKIRFKGKEHEFTRRYTRFISRESQTKEDKESTIAVQNILLYSLKNVAEWDQSIDKWQTAVLENRKLPNWFKSAIFNELYFISDGGTIWLEYDGCLGSKVPSKYAANTAVDLRSEYGRFAYLEGHEYRMYNTYDVHFYSSFALTMLWPKLQLSLQYDFADTIPYEDPLVRTHLFDGHRAPRKVKDSVPHDLGDPWEEPYIKLNAYIIHDVSEWRDLNLKFVLQVFRDFKFTKDKQYLLDMLPKCTVVMKKSLSWDKDGDGLIENSGSADQTYDSWVMTGPSAYCGGLWLASLYAMITMLKECEEDPGEIELYEDTLERGKKSYHEKLWTGEYYKFDSSSTTIQSDQLCGHWMLAMCGVDDNQIFPSSNVKKALQTIYEKNVQGVCGGEMGAVNGMNPDGTVDLTTIQSEETWTGVTYALAATMIMSGMTEEGFKTAEGIYRTVYEKIGMQFETPEALYHTKGYRAIGYMRPLSIWAIMHAITIKNSDM